MQEWALKKYGTIVLSLVVSCTYVMHLVGMEIEFTDGPSGPTVYGCERKELKNKNSDFTETQRQHLFSDRRAHCGVSTTYLVNTVHSLLEKKAQRLSFLCQKREVMVNRLKSDPTYCYEDAHIQLPTEKECFATRVELRKHCTRGYKSALLHGSKDPTIYHYVVTLLPDLKDDEKKVITKQWPLYDEWHKNRDIVLGYKIKNDLEILRTNNYKSADIETKKLIKNIVLSFKQVISREKLDPVYSNTHELKKFENIVAQFDKPNSNECDKIDVPNTTSKASNSFLTMLWTFLCWFKFW